MQVGTHTPLIGATDAAVTKQASQQQGQGASFKELMSEKSQLDTLEGVPLSEGAEGGAAAQPPIAIPSTSATSHKSFAALTEGGQPDETARASESSAAEVNENTLLKTVASVAGFQEEGAKLGNSSLITATSDEMLPPPSRSPEMSEIGPSKTGGGMSKSPALADDFVKSDLPTGESARRVQVQGAFSEPKSQALKDVHLSTLVKNQMGTSVDADKGAVMPKSVGGDSFATTTRLSSVVAQAVNLDDLISKASIEKSSTTKLSGPELLSNSSTQTGTAPETVAKALGQFDGTGRADQALRHDEATSGASTSSQVTDVASHNKDRANTAYFSNARGMPATDKLAIVQDTGLQKSSVPSPLDPIVSEQVFDLAITDARVAETLTGRAEVSAHIRTELPRHVAMQLADVAKTMPDRPVELTLSPEELGRLRLTFTGDLSAMTGSVNVERPETLDLMRRHIEMLAQEMRDIGYEEVTFSFGQSGAETDGQSSDTAPSGDRENPNSRSMGTSPDIHPAPVRLSVMGASGVDIRL